MVLSDFAEMGGACVEHDRNGLGLALDSDFCLSTSIEFPDFGLRFDLRNDFGDFDFGFDSSEAARHDGGSWLSQRHGIEMRA